MIPSAKISNLNLILKNKIPKNTEDFLEFAPSAAMLALCGDADKWKVYDQYLQKQTEKKRKSLIWKLLDEMEESVCDLEDTEDQDLDDFLGLLWGLQTSHCLWLKLKEYLVDPDKYEEMFIQLRERIYLVPKNLEIQAYVEEWPRDVNLPYNIWLDAIRFAVRNPVVAPLPASKVFNELLPLVLSFDSKLSLAASTNTIEAPSEELLEQVHREANYKSFSVEVYLTSEWEQVLKITSDKAVGIVNWLGETKIYQPSTNQCYEFRIACPTHSEQFYKEWLCTSVIRITLGDRHYKIRITADESSN